MCQMRAQLREMVRLRLDAAAEEIFALFERILAEYEEELRRATEKRHERRQEQRAECASEPQHTAPDVKTQNVPEEFPLDVPNPIDLVIKQEPEELGDDIVAIRVSSLPLKKENAEEAKPLEGTVEAIDLTTGEESQRKKPHACPICGKSYSWKSHLEIHLRVHTGEKPFGCSVCGKRFTKKMYLVIHLRRHTGEKPFSCSVCHDRFISKDSVMKHMMVVHPGLCGVRSKAKHSCGECGKAFTSRSHLEMHLRVHTGEKPFQCPECSKRFTQKATLLGHMTRHTGERPFSCPVCQKSFRQKNHVQKHINIHLRQLTHDQLQGLLSSGHLQGSSPGHLQGSSPGQLQGSSSGQLQGSSSGQLQGSSSGQLQGSSSGQLQGSSSGQLQSSSSGQLQSSSSGQPMFLYPQQEYNAPSLHMFNYST